VGISFNGPFEVVGPPRGIDVGRFFGFRNENFRGKRNVFGFHIGLGLPLFRKKCIRSKPRKHSTRKTWHDME